MKLTVRLMTLLHGATPIGTARAGHILSQDGGPVFVVEDRVTIATIPAGGYARPYGATVSSFDSLAEAVEYALRRGWTSAALCQWATDYGLTLPGAEMTDQPIHRPRFARDQATIPAGRRINDLLAYARDVAGLTAYDEPIVLADSDRLLAAMLLPEHPDPSGVLAAIIGELHTAEQHTHADDHNAEDLVQAELHRAAAAELVRDAVLADVRTVTS